MDEKETPDNHDENETLDSYEVGYRKPPKHTRFKKGVSGNPNGRPKKALDFDTALLREARTLMTINENGRQRRVSKHDVVVKQLMNNAMKGNSSGLRMYLDASRHAFERVAQLEAQRAKDLERKSVEDYTDEELTQFLRDYQETEEWMERKKLLSNTE
jgi:hypothetical protein